MTAGYRDGLADACVLILADRRLRFAGSLDDLGDAAQVTRVELQDAARRYQARRIARHNALSAAPMVTRPTAAPLTSTPARRVACEVCGAEVKERGLPIHKAKAHGIRGATVPPAPTGPLVTCEVCGHECSPHGMRVHQARMHGIRGATKQHPSRTTHEGDR